VPSIKKRIHGWIEGISRRSGLDALAQIAIDRELREIRAQASERTPLNPLLRGFKVYAQLDEDGIIEAIFEAIGVRSRLFIEIGSGSGLENNTRYLLHKGWRGAWVEGNPAEIQLLQSLWKPDAATLARDPDLCVYNGYVTCTNVDAILATCLRALGMSGAAGTEIDFLSMDIDGNDLSVLGAISAVRPRTICTEYNPKFPPPLSTEARLAEGESWNGDDFYGASLQAFVDQLGKLGYVLVSCNACGNNAFFVDGSLLAGSALTLYPPRDLYQEARYHLARKRSGHRASLSYLARTKIVFMAPSGA
jgi:hypothetical protein